jgi:hypothetical protein
MICKPNPGWVWAGEHRLPCADKNVGVAGLKACSTLPTGQEAGSTWRGFGGMSKFQGQASTACPTTALI